MKTLAEEVMVEVMVEEASEQAHAWVDGAGGHDYIMALGAPNIRSALKIAYFHGYLAKSKSKQEEENGK